MSFYVAFKNRRMKAKVRRSLTFGSKTKKKSRNTGGVSYEESNTYEWSDNSANELATYEDKGLSYPRRHSLEGSVWNGTCSSRPFRRVITPPLEATVIAPPKPPRMMEKKLFTCENPDCKKTEELLGMIAINFKACPACFTHYCSSTCRVAHWSLHKFVCHYGRIKSYMGTIAEVCQSDQDVREMLSSIASSGYNVKGRGCVMLIFANPNSARIFIEEKVGKKPTYASLGQLETLGVKTDHKKNLMKLISNYDPECELVLNVAIVAERNLPPSPVPRSKEPCVIEQFVVSLKDNGESKLNESFRRLSL